MALDEFEERLPLVPKSKRVFFNNLDITEICNRANSETGEVQVIVIVPSLGEVVRNKKGRVIFVIIKGAVEIK